MKELEELATLVRQELKVNFDSDSVKFVEDFIERNKVDFSKEQWQGLINACGAFLGQCIIENYGGKWERDENDVICVGFDEDNKVYPFAKVSKQFENGTEDSIFSFYAALPIVFNKLPKHKRGGN